MVLFFFAVVVVLGLFVVIFAYGVLCSVLRGLKRLVVWLWKRHTQKSRQQPVRYNSYPSVPDHHRPYRGHIVRDEHPVYSHVDPIPSVMNPDFVDVLDAEARGWDFERGGYADMR